MCLIEKRASEGGDLNRDVPIEEASTNFDMEQVEPFLRAVSELVEKGFGNEEIKRLLNMIEGMEHDDEKFVEFQVVYFGEEMPLVISVFMDDIDSPDISLFTFPVLAEVIDTEIEKMFSED